MMVDNFGDMYVNKYVVSMPRHIRNSLCGGASAPWRYLSSYITSPSYISRHPLALEHSKVQFMVTSPLTWRQTKYFIRDCIRLWGPEIRFHLYVDYVDHMKERYKWGS